MQHFGPGPKLPYDSAGAQPQSVATDFNFAFARTVSHGLMGLIWTWHGIASEVLQKINRMRQDW
jgi:hypothetical protein